MTTEGFVWNRAYRVVVLVWFSDFPLSGLFRAFTPWAEIVDPDPEQSFPRGPVAVRLKLSAA